MNKSIMLLSILALSAGMAFASGAGDSSDLDRPGINRLAEVEIVSLEGTLAKDSYGNLIIEEGKKNYIVRLAPTLDADLEEGDALDAEGVEGVTRYTKDGEDYIEFHITMLTVDGETLAIDMSGLYGGRGAMGGGSTMGRQGGMDRSAMGRDAMRGDLDRGDMADRFAGRGGIDGDMPFQGEEISLSGAISLFDEYHPVISQDGKNYVIMLGRGHMAGIEVTEGMTAELTGYEGRALYTEEGEEYYSFMVTSAVIDGEEVELDFASPRGGMMDKGGMRPGRRG